MKVEEFGERFLKNDITLRDMSNCDSLLLVVVDTLLTAPKNEQLFWFSVLSKIAPQTDGYLSEGFGNMAYKYIETNPLQFAANILGMKQDMPVKTNINNWVDTVYGEIGITNENEEKEAVGIYINKMSAASRRFDPNARNIIDMFCKQLKSKLSTTQ